MFRMVWAPAATSTEEKPELPCQQGVHDALVDTLEDGDADGLLAVLTSPAVRLSLHCAPIIAGSVLITPHTQSLIHINKRRNEVLSNVTTALATRSTN